MRVFSGCVPYCRTRPALTVLCFSAAGCPRRVCRDWTLPVSNGAPGDTGTLNGWTLTVGHDGAGGSVTGLAGSGSQYLVTVSAPQGGGRTTSTLCKTTASRTRWATHLPIPSRRGRVTHTPEPAHSRRRKGRACLRRPRIPMGIQTGGLAAATGAVPAGISNMERIPAHGGWL